MSQCAEILHHMQTKGAITALEALNQFGCFRLASRINDLRNDGHAIHTATIELHNGKKIASYSLLKTKGN